MPLSNNFMLSSAQKPSERESGKAKGKNQFLSCHRHGRHSQRWLFAVNEKCSKLFVPPITKPDGESGAGGGRGKKIGALPLLMRFCV